MTTFGTNTADSQKKSRHLQLFRRSIRSQLLFAVNLPLIVLGALFLGYDYNRMMSERIAEKHIALEEEAMTLLPAIIQFRVSGLSGIQEYIDNVCRQMQTKLSPGHHIAVNFSGKTLQATPHGRASSAMLSALEHAAHSPTRRAPFEEHELIVGIADSDDIVVYVAEKLTNIRHAVRWASIRRLVGLTVAFFAAAVLVNVVLLRTVTNPIGRLVTTVQKLGAGQFGIRPETFQSAELEFLASEIGSMSLSLASADRARKSQMVKAREIQENLLPKAPSIPSLRIAHFFEPAEDIGGDYYDILPLKDGTWVICIADVTGHGIPAAMSAAMLKMLLLQATETHTSPTILLEFINRRFSAVSLLEDFVSMILLRMDPQGGRLQYASAGHEPGWLISSGKTPRELSSTGLLLGIDENATWEEVNIQVTGCDRLMVFSDGLSETFNTQGEMFGRTRLIQLLIEFKALSTEQTIQRIKEALDVYRGTAPQQDDMTAVLFEVLDC